MAPPRAGLAWPLLAALLALATSAAPTSASDETVDGVFVRDDNSVAEDLLQSHLVASGGRSRAALPKTEGQANVTVHVGMAFYSLMNLDEQNNVVEMAVWLRLAWRDPLLQWDPADYGGIEQTVVDPEEIWTPDLVNYNSAEPQNLELRDTWPYVYYMGPDQPPQIFWSRPGIVKFQCGSSNEDNLSRPIDDGIAAEMGGRYYPTSVKLTMFPFDTQHCEIVWGSWIDSGRRVDFVPMGPGAPFADSRATEPSEGDSGLMSPSIQWAVSPVRVERLEYFYSCCPDEPWPQLFFYLKMTRYSEDYLRNIITPVILSVVVGFLAFMVPAMEGERVGLGITCMLTVIAVMFITVDTLPATKDPTILNAFYMGSVAFTLVPLAETAVVTWLVQLHSKEQRDYEQSSTILDLFWDLEHEDDPVTMSPQVMPTKASKRSGLKLAAKLVAPSLSVKKLYTMGSFTKLQLKGRKAWRHCRDTVSSGLISGMMNEVHHPERLRRKLLDALVPNHEDVACMLDQTMIVVCPVLYGVFLAVLTHSVFQNDNYQDGMKLYTIFAVMFAFFAWFVRFAVFVRYKAFIEKTYPRAGLTKVDEKSLTTLRQQFMALDQDGNGAISPTELLKAFHKHGRDVNRTALLRRLDRMDSDDDHKISFVEFVGIVQRERVRADMQNELQDAGVGRELRRSGTRRAHFEKFFSNMGIRSWSPDQVAGWLTTKGWDKHARTFVECGIDGKTLITLTERDLKEDAGIHNISERRALLKCIHDLATSELKSKFKRSARLVGLKALMTGSDAFSKTRKLGRAASNVGSDASEGGGAVPGSVGSGDGEHHAVDMLGVGEARRAEGDTGTGGEPEGSGDVSELESSPDRSSSCVYPAP